MADGGDAEFHLSAIPKLPDLPSHVQREVCFALMEDLAHFKHTDYRERCFKIGITPALLAVMKKNHLDTMVVRGCIGTLAMLADGCSSAHKETMAQEGAIDACLEAMREHADRVELNAEGVKAVGNLAGSQKNQVFVTRVNGHNDMLKVMKRYSGHPQLPRRVAVAIQRVIHRNPRTQYNVGHSSQKVEVVLSAMEIARGTAQAQAEFLRLLQDMVYQNADAYVPPASAFLVGDEDPPPLEPLPTTALQIARAIQTKVQQGGGVQQVLAAMEAHPSHPEVQLEGLAALAELVFEHTSLQDEVVAKGGLERALLVCKDPELLLHGGARWLLCLCARLARDNRGNQTKTLKLLAIPKLLEVLRGIIEPPPPPESPKDPNGSRSTFATSQNATQRSFFKSTSTRMMSASKTGVLKGLSEQERQLDALRQALDCIRWLALKHVSCQEAMYNSEALPGVIEALKLFPEDERLAEYGVSCIARLCDAHPDHQDFVGVVGGIEQTAHAMEQFPYSEAVQEAAAQACYCIAWDHPQNTKVLRNLPTVKRLQAAMARFPKNVEVQEKGLLTLFCLGVARAKVVPPSDPEAPRYAAEDQELITRLVQEVQEDDLGIPPWVPPDLTGDLDDVDVDL